MPRSCRHRAACSDMAARPVVRYRVLFFSLALLALASLSGCSKEARKTRALSRADRYFAQGDYDKARIEYLNVLRFDPQNVTAYARIGHIWLEDGSLFRAGAFLQKTRELAPDNLDNRVKLARVFASLGR